MHEIKCFSGKKAEGRKKKSTFRRQEWKEVFLKKTTREGSLRGRRGTRRWAVGEVKEGGISRRKWLVLVTA